MKFEFSFEDASLVKMHEEIAAKLPQKLRAAVSKTANEVLSTAKSLTPRGRSGKLLAGWERSPMRVNKAGGSVTVSNKAKHAKPIEGGHSSQAPDGMLNPALKRHGPDLYKRAEEAAQEVFDSL